MAEVILWNLITLDGFFEGPTPWSLAWLHPLMRTPAQEQHSLAQLRTADALLFGRHAYAGMAAHWQTATGEVAELMNSLPKFVFSRTLDRADWNNTTLIDEDILGHVRHLKRERSGNLFVFGSANLSRTLLAADLFDELRIGLAPTLLGVGRPLFGAGITPARLRFLDATPMPSGIVILRYRTAAVEK